MGESDVTIAELTRNVKDLRAQLHSDIADLKADMNSRYTGVEAMIRNAQFVSVDRYNPEQSEQNRRIGNLEDTIKWLSRTVAAEAIGIIGAVILIALTVWER
jgi:hypothetical protein